MKYTEIDGERYEVKDCGYCPFRDMGDDGWGAHCTHPHARKDGGTWLEIDHDGIADGCPLRDVKDQYHSMEEIIGKMFKIQKGKGILHEIKPCPFCGSTEIKERYLDDDCEEIEEWMVEEANSYVKEDGGDPYNSIDEYREVNAYYWQIYCPRCDVYMTSGLSMKDAWAKWNRRM